MNIVIEEALARIHRVSGGESVCDVYKWYVDAAAPGLTAWQREELAKECFSNDEEILAIAYLTEHPADDNMPATVEWIDGLGLDESAIGHRYLNSREYRVGEIPIYADACVGGWAQAYMISSGHKVPVTRQIVRTIAKVFQVKFNSETEIR